jgi:hypothetical protein
MGTMALGLLLAVSVIVLIFQLYPTIFDTILWAIDIRNWTRVAWFLANLAVVISLLAIRFGPDAALAWRNRASKSQAERKQREEIAERKQRRDAIEQIKQARSRRLY